ncbi:hypothetical protein ACFQVD_31710 [Streptosporangium amethystogenes subsp. fukuiense]|uniref:Leucine-rich repeat domain-containing protein n=1 Tax=Streptosporangium amethystogenes subsp. fukuiense TaxID=698418 RepID=A0ABW2T8D2_9ACTN
MTSRGQGSSGHEGLSDLTALTHLRLDVELTGLPGSLGDLTALKHLRLDGNLLAGLPKPLRRRAKTPQ